MIAQIRAELKRLEAEEHIRILLAVESGSRVWGMESVNSDWDVRFVYVHEPAWYLRLNEGRDTIERMLPGDLDLSGWDLRKTLALFRKGNPALMEWLRSPLIYEENFSAAEKLRTFAGNYFNPVTTVHHYLSMAKGNFQKYLDKQDQVKAKKYLYVLRPQLASLWVLSQQGHPPLEMEELLAAANMDEEVRLAIHRLLSEKKKGMEWDAGPRSETLHSFIRATFQQLEAAVPSLVAQEPPPHSLLDQLFLDTLKEVYPDFFAH